MQEASVREHQGAVLGISTQGSVSPFASVVFHLDRIKPAPLLHLTSHKAKSGGHRRRPRGIVVVVVAAGVDFAEIVIVVVVGGPQPRPHRQWSIVRYTPNRGYFGACLCPRLLTAPFRSSFSRSIKSPRLCAILSSLAVASLALTDFPLLVVKAPSGFWLITS